MSLPWVAVPTALMTHPEVTLGHIQAYHAIYRETLGRAGWDLSYDQLATLMGKDRRSAMRAVKWLESTGFIQQITRPGMPNLFAITDPPTKGGDTNVTPRTAGGDIHDTPSPSKRGDTHVTHQKKEPVDKKGQPAADLPGAIAKEFYDATGGLANFMQIRTLAAAALKAGHQPKDILKAFHALDAKNKPIITDTLRQELGKPKKSRAEELFRDGDIDTRTGLAWGAR